MAVHKNDVNNDTGTNNTEIPTPTGSDNGSESLHSSRPSGFGSIPFGLEGHNTTQQTEFLNEVFEAELDKVKGALSTTWGISYKLHIIRAGSKGGGTPLTSDGVAISFKKDNHVVSSSIILADADTVISPLRVAPKATVIYRGSSSLQVIRTMLDLDSRVYRTHLKSVMATAYNSAATQTNISVMRSSVISADLEKRNNSDGVITHGGNTPVDIHSLVLRVIQSMMIHLGIDILHAFDDISINDIKALGGVIGLDVSQDSGNTQTYDGVIIRPKRRMTFTVRKSDDLDNNGALVSDVHNAQSVERMGTLNLSTEVRHLNVQPVQAGLNLGGSAAPSYHKGWAPTIIIDSIEMPNHPSTGTVAMMIATLAGFMTPEIMMSMFSTDIRYLSVISNTTGKAKPEAITKKSMNTNFRQFYNALFADNYTIGMRVRPGTTSFLTDVDWLKLAGGSKKPHILKHLAKMFSAKEVLPGDLVSNHIDVHPSGVFTDASGNTTPCSSFDIRYLLEHYPDETAMHREWLVACTSRMSREERLAVKTSILTAATGNAVITGTDYIIYFNGPVIAGLRDRIAKNLILAPNNILTGGFQDLTWASHGAGSGGLEFAAVAQNTANANNGFYI